MAKAVTVKQDPAAPLPVEVLADSIKAISDGVRKLRNGPLNDYALLLLIQHAAPNVGNNPLSLKQINAVFSGIDALEATYLRKKKT